MSQSDRKEGKSIFEKLGIFLVGDYFSNKPKHKIHTFWAFIWNAFQCKQYGEFYAKNLLLECLK